MVDFIRIQYQLGNITEKQVFAYAPRWITKEEAQQIVGPKLTKTN